MEEQFIQLGEDKYAYVSQGGQKIGKEIYIFMEDIQYTYIWWDFPK